MLNLSNIGFTAVGKVWSMGGRDTAGEVWSMGGRDIAGKPNGRKVVRTIE